MLKFLGVTNEYNSVRGQLNLEIRIYFTIPNLNTHPWDLVGVMQLVKESQAIVKYFVN